MLDAFLVTLIGVAAAQASQAAVATFLFGAGHFTWRVAAFGPVGAVSGLLIHGTSAHLFSTRAVGSLYRRVSRAVEGVFGLAFGALGTKLALDGLRP